MFIRSAIAAATAALVCVLLTASPGHALTTRYVAAGGTSTTGCDLATTACPDLQAAVSASVAGDTIICLSTPFAQPLTITKSITIDCSAAPASVANSFSGATDGSSVRLSINAPGGQVRLRGLIIDGSFSGSTPIDRGIDIQAAAAVYIEDCLISNFVKQGIFDHRTGGQTKLFIKDTRVSHSGAGIVAVSGAVGLTVLDNVTSENSNYGIAVGNGNNVVIRNSVFSGNSVAGVEGDVGSQTVISNSTISHNNVGIQSSTSVRFSENYISFNNTAFSGLAATLGQNRYTGNVSMGTAPSTAIPNAPADIGP